MTSISGEALAQSERGISVKTMSTQFAAIMMAETMEANIRKRIKCCFHEGMIDHKIVDEVVTAARQHKRSAYHYEFVFFDIAEPGKKRPFLMLYTVARVISDERIELMVMTMVSDNSVLEWHKVEAIPVYDTVSINGVLSDCSSSIIGAPLHVKSLYIGGGAQGRMACRTCKSFDPCECPPYDPSKVVATVYHVTMPNPEKYLYGLYAACGELLQAGY